MFNGYFLFSPLHIASGDASRPKLLHTATHSGATEVRVIPVGGDGGGDLFVMSTSLEAAGTVWKWNHEYPVRVDGLAKDGVVQLSDTFAGFLERIAEDWEHFVMQDSDWPYFAG